jgi:hypothetical protein
MTESNQPIIQMMGWPMPFSDGIHRGTDGPFLSAYLSMGGINSCQLNVTVPVVLSQKQWAFRAGSWPI